MVVRKSQRLNHPKELPEEKQRNFREMLSRYSKGGSATTFLLIFLCASILLNSNTSMVFPQYWNDTLQKYQIQNLTSYYYWDPRASTNSQHNHDPSSPTNPKKKPRTVHLLSGLYGNTTGFMEQWEVNFKSSLINAPLDHPLHLHLIVNGAAQQAVLQRLTEKMRIQNFNTRQPLTISLYNVDALHEEWTAFLLSKFRGKGLEQYYPMGVYYRLLAYQVILPYCNSPTTQNNTQRKFQTDSIVGSSSNTTVVDPKERITSVNPVLYMDADVVVLANLNDLWRNVLHDQDDDKYNTTNMEVDATSNNNSTTNAQYPFLQWSSTWPNSGFAIYYMQRMPTFWKLLDSLPEISHTNDQSLLGQVHDAFPNATGTLPREWDVHMGHGWRGRPQSILWQQERVGMAHFTGDPPTGSSYLDDNGVIKYCLRVGQRCGDDPEGREQYMQTWGLVDYYIRLPWHYVRYFMESQVPIGAKGHSVLVQVVTAL